MEDGYVVAKCLREQPDVMSAFQEYEVLNTSCCLEECCRLAINPSGLRK
ncbi:MAG: hypothetical protein VKL59_00365 [Nostocaceae cyanobacterium]|nr:hypothetical protein [Nostocaceae cyanobacterium]